MKRIFTFCAICVSLVFSSCSEIDHAYITEFKYVNNTEHTVHLNIPDLYTRGGSIGISTANVDMTYMIPNIKPGEIASYKLDGPYGFCIKRTSQIGFDEHVVLADYRPGDDSPTNICLEKNYVKTHHDDNEYHTIFTYTITEADYDYACSLNDVKYVVDSWE